MSDKQFTDLSFKLTRFSDGSTISFGIDKYAIVKSNGIFNNILSYSSSIDERDIEFEVYIDNAIDVFEFGKFFKMSDSEERYDLTVNFNSKTYTCEVTLDETPFKINKLEDLYGTRTQPTTSITVSLIMKEPFFYGGYVYEVDMGGEITGGIKFPLPISLDDTVSQFSLSTRQTLLPVLLENGGNEDNGVIIYMYVGSLLVNPRFRNVTTNLSMKFNLEADTGDLIIIDTIKKTFSLNGEYLYNVKDLFDTWLILQNGSNIIDFTAEKGQESCNIIINYFNKYRFLGEGL